MKTLSIILTALILTSCTSTSTPEQKNPNIITKEGRFHHVDMFFDNSDELHCQFRSDDDEIWWILTESEINHIPNTEDKYILTYDNGGTPEQDLSICGCLPEWECECHVYDDEFISIRRVEQ
jgi:hypothetical protein